MFVKKLNKLILQASQSTGLNSRRHTSSSIKKEFCRYRLVFRIKITKQNTNILSYSTKPMIEFQKQALKLLILMKDKTILDKPRIK